MNGEGLPQERPSLVAFDQPLQKVGGEKIEFCKTEPRMSRFAMCEVAKLLHSKITNLIKPLPKIRPSSIKEGVDMGLAAVAVDTKANTGEEGSDLFERMKVLLDRMDSSLKQGMIAPADREVFLEIYTRGRAWLSEWEQGVIDEKWDVISHSDKYMAYFGDNIHHGPSEYDCFTR